MNERFLLNEPPPHSAEIIPRLLRGYQFSESDTFGADADLYAALTKHYAWFEAYLIIINVQLVVFDDVILARKPEDPALTSEEQQTFVVILLLGDLWMERGTYSDLTA